MKNRDISLDFLKGLSVVVMIGHHSINYYPITFHLLKYLRFVTGAFVLLTGLVLSSSISTNNKLCARLRKRGLKLLLLCLSINFMITLCQGKLTHNFIEYEYLKENFFRIFIHGDYRKIVFDLLIPISYIILIWGLVGKIIRKNIPFFLTSLVIISVIISILHYETKSGYNIRYFNIGLIGIGLGLYYENIKCFIEKNMYILLVVFCLYLFFLRKISLNYPNYILTVILNLIFFYIIYLKTKIFRNITEPILQLGKYSLVSYMFHILLLYICKEFGIMKEGYWTALIFTFLTIITIVFVYIVDFLRQRYEVYENMYRFIFK